MNLTDAISTPSIATAVSQLLDGVAFYMTESTATDARLTQVRHQTGKN
jgi:hypothetical protein